MDNDFFSLTPESINYLDTARKWAMFLAVIGFISVFLLLVMGIFMAFFLNFVEMPAEYSQMPSGIFGTLSIAYIVMAIIYFIPVWYLFQFSRKMGTAIDMNDKILLTNSFGNLKNCFISYGILIIIGIIFYFIFMAFGFFTALGTMGSVTA